jgi:hypothetical protein
MAANVIMTQNPQRVYITATNTDQTLDYSNILGSDDFMGTILIDNISASVRFNTAGAVDPNYSGVYTTTDKCLFDARRSGSDSNLLHYYGASGTSFQVYISTQ